jgi:hypothetical protein
MHNFASILFPSFKIWFVTNLNHGCQLLALVNCLMGARFIAKGYSSKKVLCTKKKK